MLSYVAVFTIYLTLVQARPGLHGGGASTALIGVPDVHSFGSIQFPELNIQDLGSSVEGHIPPTTIKIHKTVGVKVPQPYPVEVPHNIPVPVPVHKPYPVPVTQYVKIPHPVPVEVIKKVPVPIEVPKPYPVPVDEYNSNQGQGSYAGSATGSNNGFSHSYGQHGSSGGEVENGYGGGSSYGGGGYGGSASGGNHGFSNSYGVPSQSYGEHSSSGGGLEGGFEGSSSYGGGGYGDSSEGQGDQSAGYQAVAKSDGSYSPEGSYSQAEGEH